MPRAFMFTRKLGDDIPEIPMNEMEIKENMSPEQSVSITESAETSISCTEDLTNDTDSSSECPDELYNLTKLANVSVAAAAGKIFDRRHLSTGKNVEEEEFMYTHKLFDKSTKAVRGHLIKRDKRPKSPNTFINLSTPPRITLLSNNNQIHTPQNDSTSNEETSNDPPQAADIEDDEASSQANNNKRHKTIEAEELPTEQQMTSSVVESHSCRDCGKRYSTSSNLARHRQTHRSPGDKKARRCPHCDKLYVSMPAYAMHVRTHTQGCRCQFCGKCFSRPWLLQGHIRTHTGEKPFKCSICNKAFADKSNLRAHVQTHSNLKPHVCKRCGKAFALKSYLYKHEESSCMRYHNNNNNVSIKSEDADLSSCSPISSTVIVQNSSVIMKNTNNFSVSVDSTSSSCHSIVSSSSCSEPDDLQQQIPPPKLLQHNSLVSTFLSPLKTVPPNMYFRSTVISPNPERILYSTIEHPSVILNAATRFYAGNKYLQEQPMDFSKGVKMAIAV